MTNELIKVKVYCLNEGDGNKHLPKYVRIAPGARVPKVLCKYCKNLRTSTLDRHLTDA